MCGAMLRWIREQMRFEPRDMRAVLVAPGADPMKRRTYEDYEAGRRGIKESVAAAARELYRNDRAFMAEIGGVQPIQNGPAISPGEILRQRQQAEFAGNFQAVSPPAPSRRTKP